jgi:hypothetical protein
LIHTFKDKYEAAGLYQSNQIMVVCLSTEYASEIIIFTPNS